jgi:hypothetical protein
VTGGGFPYVWVWRQRTLRIDTGTFRGPWFGDGVDRVGQACRVVARGGMNSALVEFADGYRVITSRGGLRRVSPAGEGAEAASRPAPADTTR